MMSNASNLEPTQHYLKINCLQAHPSCFSKCPNDTVNAVMHDCKWQSMTMSSVYRIICYVARSVHVLAGLCVILDTPGLASTHSGICASQSPAWIQTESHCRSALPRAASECSPTTCVRNGSWSKVILLDYHYHYHYHSANKLPRWKQQKTIKDVCNAILDPIVQIKCQSFILVLECCLSVATAAVLQLQQNTA